MTTLRSNESFPLAYLKGLMPNSILSTLRRRWNNWRVARLSLPSMQDRLRARTGLVVLCYHSVRDDLQAYPYAITCAAFREHLRFINRNCKIIDAQQAYEFLLGYGEQYDRPVVLITFDDGFADNLFNATPVLEEFDAPALLFAAKYPVTSPLSTFLSEEALAQLASHPLWTVGAHGTTHLSLPSLLMADVDYELEDCVKWLHSILGAPPRWFAYPYGRHSPTILSSVERWFDAAYEVTPTGTAGADRRRISRLLVTQDHTNIATFARLLLTKEFIAGGSA